ncbi:MAG TPA: 23S rRNA (uracil(1939)-C(5))-methyltransferase RlmD [Terracidiphilus sp.]|nr:23S rRNA (uracil(1939)-C(5))-methyltransferase RlmD [Terracidiphilus sp.]
MKPRRHQRRANNPSAAPSPSQLVTIEKPVYGGNFLARSDGKAIFVPMALPGEQAQVRIVEDKARRGYAVAEVDAITAPAAERIAPRCPHFGTCGGCQYQHTDYPAQLRFKEAILRETFTRAGIAAPNEIAVLSGDPWEYRNRIRVAFDAKGNVGYRGRRSHAIIPIRECPIASPVLVRAALAAAELFKKSAPSLRPSELSLFANPEEDFLLASVFAEGRALAPLTERLEALIEEFPGIGGVDLIAQDEGRREQRAAQIGAASLSYRAAGFDYRVDNGAFFQVNRRLLDPLVGMVTQKHTGALAWDLFAGVGLFARKLTASFDKVIAVESAPAATKALAANLAGTTGESVPASALDFLRGNSGGQRPDLIVVDPPRTGLGEEITREFARIAAPSMVYVSCDPVTLARDLRPLLASGYAIESVTLADLFPQTFHLETLVHIGLS